MRWSVAEAKKRLSELLRAAGSEPQVVERRGEPIAAVVDYDSYRVWAAEHEQRSLADATAELRRISAEEGYELEVPARTDRATPFADGAAL